MAWHGTGQTDNEKEKTLLSQSQDILPGPYHCTTTSPLHTPALLHASSPSKPHLRLGGGGRVRQGRAGSAECHLGEILGQWSGMESDVSISSSIYSSSSSLSLYLIQGREDQVSSHTYHLPPHTAPLPLSSTTVYTPLRPFSGPWQATPASLHYHTAHCLPSLHTCLPCHCHCCLPAACLPTYTYLPPSLLPPILFSVVVWCCSLCLPTLPLIGTNPLPLLWDLGSHLPTPCLGSFAPPSLVGHACAFLMMI